jgi:hypothetical protein
MYLKDSDSQPGHLDAVNELFALQPVVE